MLTYYTRKESRVQMVASDFWGTVAAATCFRRLAETNFIHPS
jgi:hypothetical protein